jgi:hypothetical protein
VNYRSERESHISSSDAVCPTEKLKRIADPPALLITQ